MIEKRKGTRKNKLRIRDMIEADMQLIMRGLLAEIMNDKVEEDKRLSKHDHGSRRGHSIETTLLEKRLMLTFPRGLFFLITSHRKVSKQR